MGPWHCTAHCPQHVCPILLIYAIATALSNCHVPSEAYDSQQQEVDRKASTPVGVSVTKATLNHILGRRTQVPHPVGPAATCSDSRSKISRNISDHEGLHVDVPAQRGQVHTSADEPSTPCIKSILRAEKPSNWFLQTMKIATVRAHHCSCIACQIPSSAE